MANPNKTASSANGFTILELLVAVSVLAILVILAAQLISSASVMATSSMKRMAADEEARLVLDRMTADFSRIVKREDVDCNFVSNPANDEMYFYSEAPAIFTDTTGNNSPLALIGYRLDTNGLSRISQGKSWDEVMFLTIGNGTTNSSSLIDTNSITSTNTILIAPSVFRMQYSLLMKQGTTNVAGGINSANTFSKANLPGYGLKDVSAVVVTLAVLDESSRKLVDPATIAANFVSTTGPAAESWTAAAGNLTSVPARAATRIYQRYIPVNP